MSFMLFMVQAFYYYYWYYWDIHHLNWYYWDIHHLNNDQPAFLNCLACSLPTLPIVFGVFGLEIRGQWGSGALI